MDRSSSREPAGTHNPPVVGVSGANTNRADQRAIAAARPRDRDPLIAALQASIVHDDPSANSDPPRAARTIQGRFGPIPAANPIVPAVQCESCQLQRMFE
jgi:hypothetical protein